MAACRDRAKMSGPAQRGRALQRLVLLTVLITLVGCTARPVAVTFKTGLDQPRGLALDANGNVIIAEAGARTPPHAGQVQATTNHSGRVVQVTPAGVVTLLMDRLPYTYQEVSGDVGVSDVVFAQGQIYVLTGEGNDTNLSRRLLRYVPGDRAQRVANFFTSAEDTDQDVDPELGRIKANPYALLPALDGSGFYVSDGASGRILHVGREGVIQVFAELSGAPPLTGMAFGPDGRLYVADFSLWPHTPGSGSIWAADSIGKVTLAADRLTMPIDVAFDPAGRLYVLEFSDGQPPEKPYAPRRGRLLRFTADGDSTVVMNQLNYPTAMLFTAHGDLLIAVNGAFSTAGEGMVLRVPCAALSLPTECVRWARR